MAKVRGASAYGALAGGVVAISWSAIFVRWTGMPGVASAFYRMFFASVVLWVVLLTSRVRWTSAPASGFWLAGLSGLFFAGDVGLFNTAVLRTSAGSATFLANNAPLAVGLLTWAVTRKLPARRFWTALAIALAGAWLIVSVDASHMRSEMVGDMLAVGSSVCFAMYLVSTEWSRKNFDTRALVTLSATGSAIALLVFAVSTHVSLAVPSVRSLAALLGLGMVCQVTGYFCLTYALGHLPATVTSVVLLAVAPLTAVIAFLLFGERLTVLQILGSGLVVFGVWIATKAQETPRLNMPSE
jgi:drug/metabolite transporter (DMT)-like permease